MSSNKYRTYEEFKKHEKLKKLPSRIIVLILAILIFISTIRFN